MSERHFIVYANNVQVGTITEAWYRALSASTHSRASLFLKQFLNYGRVFLIALSRTLIYTPMACFWSLVFIASQQPESLALIMSAVAKTDTLVVIKELLRLVGVCAGFTSIAVCIHAFFFSRSLGLRNVFSEEINRRIRLHISLPVDADLELLVAPIEKP